MKSIPFVLTLLTLAGSAFAQEKLSTEEARYYAKAVGADAKQLNATPIATAVDLQQPVALRDENYGGMVLPQKGLQTDTLAKVGTTAVPIGQLWLYNLTLMQDYQAVSADQLRLVTVSADGETASAPQCTLAVRKNDAGKLELLVLGRSTTPLLTVPLEPVKRSQLTPLDLEAERFWDSGKLKVNVLGQYTATLWLTELAR